MILSHSKPSSSVSNGYTFVVPLSPTSKIYLGMLRVTPGEDKPADPFLDCSSIVGAVMCRSVKTLLPLQSSLEQPQAAVKSC